MIPKFDYQQITPELSKVLLDCENKIKKRKLLVLQKYKEIEEEMQLIIKDMKEVFVNAGADEKDINKSFSKFNLKNNVPKDLEKILKFFK